MARLFRIYLDSTTPTVDGLVAGTPPNWVTPNPQTRPLVGSLYTTPVTTNILLGSGYAEDGTYASVGALPANFVPLTAYAKIGSVAPTGAGYTWTLGTIAAGVGQTVSENNVTVTYQSPPPSIATLAADTIQFDFSLSGAAVLQFGVSVNTGAGLSRGLYGTYTLLRADSTSGGDPVEVPAHGPLAGGTSFTVLGYDFSAGTPTVTVGGLSATSVVVSDDLTLTCVSPAWAGAAGAQDVIVSLGAASSTVTGGFVYDASGVWYFNPLTNHYQYAETDPGLPWTPGDPVFTETSLTPATGTTLGGD